MGIWGHPLQDCTSLQELLRASGLNQTIITDWIVHTGTAYALSKQRKVPGAPTRMFTETHKLFAKKHCAVRYKCLRLSSCARIDVAVSVLLQNLHKNSRTYQQNKNRSKPRINGFYGHVWLGLAPDGALKPAEQIFFGAHYGSWANPLNDPYM